MLDLDLIRLDGGTQTRVELNQEVVAEYAQAYRAGADMPPVAVYFDGSDRWLADGFHRYFGAKAAGLSEILEKITPGTKQDALVYGLGANGKHGLRRTNADKRHAVELALGNAVLGKQSDNAIAKICDVSQPFVSELRRANAILNPLLDAPAARTVTRKGRTYEQKTGKIGKKRAKPGKLPPEPEVAVEDRNYGGPDQAEIDATLTALDSDMHAFMLLVNADDKLASAVAEIKRLTAEVAILKLTRDGWMSECAAAIRRVKSLQYQLNKLTKK